MKNLLLFICVALSATLLLQSCRKNDHGFQPADDKLLLSEVTGHIDAADPTSLRGFNGYAYNIATADYSSVYSYRNSQYGGKKITLLDKISYFTGGSWDFVYNNFIPDRTIDHSFPNRDLGYWKFYTNEKGQIEKTGLAFSEAAERREYEFYFYDNKNKLVSFIYGKYVDTPYFKFTYDYDSRGNLIGHNYLYPTSFGSSISARVPTINKTTALPAGLNPVLTRLFDRLNTVQSKAIASRSVPAVRAARTAPDANVVYAKFFSTKISFDESNNPYNELGRFLFYPTNRMYSFNLIDFYLPLMEHNPTKVEYVFDMGDGTFQNADQTFSYTYNRQHYPVTIKEVNSDPATVLWGDYTQNFSLNYIENK